MPVRKGKSSPALMRLQTGLKSANDSECVLALFSALARQLNLHICLHDNLGLASIPRALKEHINPACLHIKARRQRLCTAFDAIETHATLSSRPEGIIHRCHAGYLEVAVPIFIDGAFVGVLFAGPLLPTEGPEPKGVPREMLPRRAPSEAWLEDCRQIMLAAAARLGQILRPADWPSASSDRHTSIHKYLCASFSRDISLSDLAQALHLSESRAGHLVKRLFGMPFSELVESFRLRNAAELLFSSDLPVSELAAKSGFKDQNYFSRRFKLAFGMPPLKYRQSRRRMASA